jgi:hypothetical protein
MNNNNNNNAIQSTNINTDTNGYEYIHSYHNRIITTTITIIIIRYIAYY